VISDAQGVLVVTKALQHVDDRPFQALEFLGLMAQEGHTSTILRSGGLALLQDSLASASNGAVRDETMRCTCIMSFGRVAKKVAGKKDIASLHQEGFSPQTMADLILTAVTIGRVDGVDATTCAVAGLDWLARGDKDVKAILRKSAALKLLLKLIR